jgi:hypothetical protein
LKRTTRFALVPDWIIGQVSPQAISLYAALDRFAGQDGLAFPRRKLLAERSNISEATVKRAAAELEKIGALVRDIPPASENRPTHYYLRRDPALSEPTPARSEPTPALPEPPSRARPEMNPNENQERRTPETPPFPKTVGRRRVTVDEQRLAESILLEFNDVFSTRFTLAAWGAKLVLRIREHSGLDRADHRRIIEAQARAPWWSGSPSPSVIYGNAAIFERAIQTSIEPDDLSRKLTPEQIAERFRGRA